MDFGKKTHKIKKLSPMMSRLWTVSIAHPMPGVGRLRVWFFPIFRFILIAPMNSQRSCNFVTSGDFEIIYLQCMCVGGLLTRMSASQACNAHRSQKRALYPLDRESQVLVHCEF